MTIIGKRNLADCVIEPSYDEKSQVLRVFVSNTHVKPAASKAKMADKLRGLFRKQKALVPPH